MARLSRLKLFTTNWWTSSISTRGNGASACRRVAKSSNEQGRHMSSNKEPMFSNFPAILSLVLLLSPAFAQHDHSHGTQKARPAEDHSGHSKLAPGAQHDHGNGLNSAERFLMGQSSGTSFQPVSWP